MRRNLYKEFIRENRRTREWLYYGVEPPRFTPLEVVLLEADAKYKRRLLATEIELEAMRYKLERRQRYNQVKAVKYATIAAAIGKLLATTTT